MSTSYNSCGSYLSCIPAQSYTCSIIAAAYLLNHCSRRYYPASTPVHLRLSKPPTDVQLCTSYTYCCAAAHLLHLLLCICACQSRHLLQSQRSTAVRIRQCTSAVALVIPSSSLIPTVDTSIVIMLVPHMRVPPSPLKTHSNNSFSQ